MHQLAAGQETPDRALPEKSPSLGLRGDCRVHTEPFHRAATLVPVRDVGSEPPPTAVHALEELHDTPDHPLSPATVGAGEGSSVQCAPALAGIAVHSIARATRTLPIRNVREFIR
jgi:hypothetical protein